MRIPRWTTYPAIALILMMVVIALPRRNSGRGAALSKRAQLALSEQEAEYWQENGQQVELELVQVVDFLPEPHVEDGSIDYRIELQWALDASPGKRLELPDFPLRVGRTPGESYGLRLLSGVTLSGSPNSKIVTEEKGLQLLVGEGVRNVSLEGFSLVGPGGDGMEAAHGLLQIVASEDIHISRLTLRDADAHGMVFLRVHGLSLEDCLIEGASGSGIHLSSCTDSLVDQNRVINFGGQTLLHPEAGSVGIQLSSAVNVQCLRNSIDGGSGVGILCNATDTGVKPSNCLITGNSVSDVQNLGDPSFSGGIYLTNGQSDKRTWTVVSDNYISNCGHHGIYLEHHGVSSLTRNQITTSLGTGMLVGSIEDVLISDNLIQASADATAIRVTSEAQLVTLLRNLTGEGEGPCAVIDETSAKPPLGETPR